MEVFEALRGMARSAMCEIFSKERRCRGQEHRPKGNL